MNRYVRDDSRFRRSLSNNKRRSQSKGRLKSKDRRKSQEKITSTGGTITITAQGANKLNLQWVYY